MSQEKRTRIVLVAGEPSGDFLGYRLMKALKKQNPSIQFYGVGGVLMEEEGLQSFFPLSSLSIMSIFENFAQTFRVWRRLEETAQKIEEISPDVVVTIDFPGFNFRLGRKLKKRLKGTPLIHYVAPTVWAWRGSRAKKVSKFLDHILTLFPFEPPYFKTHKLPSTFVGHPVVEMGFAGGDGKRFMSKHGLSARDTLITLLPGSRMVELKYHLPIFQNTISLLSSQVPRLKVVIPTLPSLGEYLEKNWASSVPTIFITDMEEKKDAYASSQIAIAASGTIALELAQAGLPMVIGYKVSRLSALIVKMLVHTKYFCMINILLHKYVIPELLQQECTAKKLSLEALKVLRNPQKRQQQKEAFHRVDTLLNPSHGLPSEKAAAVILGYTTKE